MEIAADAESHFPFRGLPLSVNESLALFDGVN